MEVAVRELRLKLPDYQTRGRWFYVSIMGAQNKFLDSNLE